MLKKKGLQRVLGIGLWLVTGLVYGYGMECERPTITAEVSVSTPFQFTCMNTTESVTFGSYEVFALPVPGAVITASACSGPIAPQQSCAVNGTFKADSTGSYLVDFNQIYGGVTYYDIFCQSSAGCVKATVTNGGKFASTAVGYAAVGAAPLIMLSPDQGATWVAVERDQLPTFFLDLTLNALTCIDLRCNGVGYYYTLEGGTDAFIITSENGGAEWTVVDITPPDDSYSNSLNSVTCTGTACTAVGYYYEANNQAVLIYTSENGGSTWTEVNANAIDPPDGTYSDAYLNSVTCTDTACTAVGRYYNGNTPAVLIYNSNNGGSTWKGVDADAIDPPANFYFGPSLNSVTCTGTACTAVGRYYNGNTQAVLIYSKAEGESKWVGVDAGDITPPSDTYSNAFLNSVACTGTGCTAVGAYDNGEAQAVLIYSKAEGESKWAGVAASAITPPSGPYFDAFLNSVTCTTGTSCKVVGSYHNEEGETVLMYNRAEGESTWTAVDATSLTLPSDLRNSAVLNSVRCIGTTCIAGGQYTNVGPRVPLILNANSNGSWTGVESTSIVPPDVHYFHPTLQSVICSGPVCIGVGEYDNEEESAVLILKSENEGAQWAATTIIPPHGPYADASLNAVTCAGMACTAVGSYNNGNTQAVLIYNSEDRGSTWKGVDADDISPPPNGSYANPFLNSVTCTDTSCTAVGGYYNGNNGAVLIYTSKNGGSTWKGVDAEAISPPDGTYSDASLNSVTCMGTACTAVGSYYNGDTGAVLIYNSNNGGATWAGVKADDIFLPNDTYIDASLNSVACTGSNCRAIGGYSNGNEVLPLILNSNNAGSQWTGVNSSAITLPHEIIGGELKGISGAFSGKGGARVLGPEFLPQKGSSVNSPLEELCYEKNSGFTETSLIERLEAKGGIKIAKFRR